MLKLALVTAISEDNIEAVLEDAGNSQRHGIISVLNLHGFDRAAYGEVLKLEAQLKDFEQINGRFVKHIKQDFYKSLSSSILASSANNVVKETHELYSSYLSSRN